MLPQSVELYNIAEDPSETKNLAAEYPDKVAELQKRASELAAEAESPILLDIEIRKMLDNMHLPPSLPPTLDSFNAG